MLGEAIATHADPAIAAERARCAAIVESLSLSLAVVSELDAVCSVCGAGAGKRCYGWAHLPSGHHPSRRWRAVAARAEVLAADSLAAIRDGGSST